MTQCERVMEYMVRFGSISTMEAFTDLGITRLASRIHDLTRMEFRSLRQWKLGKIALEKPFTI